MMTTIGIIQPSFIPWRGYFDFTREVDIFELLDDVQYMKHDWRNRTRDGQKVWFSVPVCATRSDLICDAPLDEGAD